MSAEEYASGGNQRPHFTAFRYGIGGRSHGKLYGDATKMPRGFASGRPVGSTGRYFQINSEAGLQDYFRRIGQN